MLNVENWFKIDDVEVLKKLWCDLRNPWHDFGSAIGGLVIAKNCGVKEENCGAILRIRFCTTPCMKLQSLP